MRERVLENPAFDLGGGGGPRNAPGSRHYCIDEELGPRPFFMCLGDPGGCEQSAGSAGPAAPGFGIGTSQADVVDVYDGMRLLDDGADAGIDCSTHIEQ